MANKLSHLFDRQRFQQNSRLSRIISDVESRYPHALSDDDLELVSAAGDASAVPGASSPFAPMTSLGQTTRSGDGEP